VSDQVLLLEHCFLQKCGWLVPIDSGRKLGHFHVVCNTAAGFLLGLLFDLKDGRVFIPERRLNFNGLHGVISHKTELFNTQGIPESKKSLTIYIEIHICVTNFRHYNYIFSIEHFPEKK
jgi:hypothetical protein